MRKFTLDRWNWSEKAGKWVFVKIGKGGKRTYIYQLEPPQEFIDLTMELKKINQRLMNSNSDENLKFFEEMQKITRKMQSMRR